MLATALTALLFATPPMPTELFDTLKWRHIGPFRGGRSCAVAGLPSDRQTYYFGSCGGGVWKTKDAGRSWQNVSDGSFGGSIGAVAVSESDKNVVYVGGGEKTIRGNVSSGDGIWKSTDAGKSWEWVGLPESRHVGRIRIHPSDPEIVYVAVMGHLSGPNEERGVYRTQDGGKSWERVLHVNPHAGAVDLTFDPTNPRILFASTWRFLRSPYRMESGGEGSGLWRSPDGGDTWTEITHHEGMPQAGPFGIIGVAVSPVNPDRLFAIVEHQEGGLFRSDDGGETWERVNAERKLRQRAWYYSRVYTDPKDEDVVYVLNVGFHRSKDGGKTFERIETPHVDNHDLWIDPNDNHRMIEANDGGVNISEDRGATWSKQSNQPTAQFYRVSTDDHFPYRLYGAQQDNSSVRIRSRSLHGKLDERDWEPTAGGESGHIAPHPVDPEIVYGGSFGGYLTRRNHRTDEARIVTVWPSDPMGQAAADLKVRFNWNFPIFFSPHDPNRLYAAGNLLFCSTDEGQSWSAISPDLTRDDEERQGSSGGPITQDNTGVEYYSTIFAALESPHQPGLFWCGSDDGLLHLSQDHGRTWQDVTPPELPEWSQINSIELDPFEPAGLYLAATRYKLDDFSPYLFRTKDYGRTWRRIDAGIDPLHFTRVVRADPERKGLLFAGTERGVYISFDDGERWQPLGLELPIVPITDLAIKEGDLIAATQGRSFWILDDLPHLRQLELPRIESKIDLFQPKPVYRLRGGFRSSQTVEGAGQNPPGGAVIRLWLKELPNASVELAILGPEGDPIRSWSGTPKGKQKAKREGSEATDASRGDGEKETFELEPGMNRFEWDLTHEAAERFEKMVLWNGNLQGPRVVPSRYQVRLTVGEQEWTEPLTVLKDPRSESTIEEIQAQVAFVLNARDKLSETHRAIRRIRQVKGQIPRVTARAGDSERAKELETLGEEIVDRLTRIEETLYQTQNVSRQDPLNFPIRLNDKLAGLASGVSRAGDYPPTAQAIQVSEELTAAIDEQLEELRAIEAEPIPRFNQLAHDLAIPYVERTDQPDS